MSAQLKPNLKTEYNGCYPIVHGFVAEMPTRELRVIYAQVNNKSLQYVRHPLGAIIRDKTLIN